MPYLLETSKEYKKLKEEWNCKAFKIHTIDDFVEFYHELFDNYNHNYSTSVDVASCLAMAAANLVAKEQGMTGFQMSCVMWDYIRNMHYRNNKAGMKLLDYDKMLYPQYEYVFEKTIDYDTWDALQKEAKENLFLDGQNNFAHPDVINHWISIVNGKVPFGYKVE